MDGVSDGAASYVKGSFTLLVGNFVSLFIMALGSILVARMLSPSDFGLYGISLVLPDLFLLFSDWGVDSALTRFLARYRADEEEGKIRMLEWVALLFKFGVGGFLSLALFFSADFFSAALLKRPGVGRLVRLASLLVLFQSLFSTVVSGLAGLGRMDLRAVVSVIQAVVKGVSSPFFIYIGFGVSGPLIGHVSSYVAASLLGISFMVSSSPGRGGGDEVGTAIGEALSLMLGFGVPLFLGGLVAGFAGRLHGFFLSWFVSDTAFGNYRVALNFTRLVSLVTGAMVVTLFPTFSRLSYVTEPVRARKAFLDSVRYSSMFVIPMICLLAAVSEPMIHVLFSNRYPQAPLLLPLFLIPTLFVGVGALSLGSFLNSQGETRISMRVGLVGSVVSILVSPVLIWMYGVFGLAVSIIVSSAASSIYGVYTLRGKYGFNPDLGHSLRTLVSSMISAGFSFGVLWLLSDVKPFLGLFFGSSVFLIAYLFLAPITGAIEEGDIGNLDSMLRGLKVVYPFARILLGFEKRIIGLTHRRVD